MQPMLNNPQIHSVASMFYQYDNVKKEIMSRQKTWAQAIILPTIFGGESVGFDSKNSNFERMIRPRQNPMQVIAAQTPSSGTSSTLTLTWSDSSYDNFRVNDVISDSKTLKEGKVVSHAPGSVVIEVQPGSPYFDTATDFKAGTTVYFHYNRSRTFNSGGTENRFWVNDTQNDYSDITNESIQLARNEQIYSTIGENGEIYVWNQQIQDSTDDFMRQIAMKYWFSKGGSQNSSAGYETSTIGIRSRIIEQGQYTPSSTAPTLSTLISMGEFMASKNGSPTQNFLFLMGRKALISIQQDPDIKGLITNSGVLNTVGGKDVSGLDVRTFSIGAMTFNFMVAPFLSDSLYLGDWNAFSIYGLDLTPIPTLGSDFGSQSPIFKIHRGSGSESQLFSYVPGKKGISGLTKGVSGVQNSYRVTASNIDGDLFNAQADCGISCVAENFALFEKIA